ncbi:MAG TPA: SMI1/KNR4 family protein [Longimicrobium sp.]|nr:SMI1/KNR4 family protein [Longimicrobium sp.]
MIPYHDLLHRLRASSSGDFSAGNPASAGAIAEAESRLGVRFPLSYRRFLEVLGELEVPPREVFGITSSGDFSVVAQSVLWRNERVIPATAVVIEVDGMEGDPVGLIPSANGAESPIVRWEQDRATPIAIDFGDYLAALVEDVLPVGTNTSAARTFDPPWGQRRVGGSVEVDRKEVKLAYTLVQRIQYDGVSFAQLVQELNSRRIPVRGLREWTVEAAKEAYETWKDRY